MKNQGEGVIRLGDKTSHGGEVVEALVGMNVLGIAVACEGYMTSRPQCDGKFAIRTRSRGKQHKGVWLAYDNDVTDCGAKLISSI